MCEKEVTLGIPKQFGEDGAVNLWGFKRLKSESAMFEERCVVRLPVLLRALVG
jgi:hypothetical protein